MRPSFSSPQISDIATFDAALPRAGSLLAGPLQYGNYSIRACESAGFAFGFDARCTRVITAWVRAWHRSTRLALRFLEAGTAARSLAQFLIEESLLHLSAHNSSIPQPTDARYLCANVRRAAPTSNESPPITGVAAVTYVREMRSCHVKRSSSHSAQRKPSISVVPDRR